MVELEYPFDAAYLIEKKKFIKKKLLKQESSGLLQKKIAILSGSTVGILQDILELFLLDNDIKPEFWQGQYNRFYEEGVFISKELEEFHPDVIYIHTTSRNLYRIPEPVDTNETTTQKLSEEYSHFNRVWNNLLEKIQCPIIINNFEPISYRLLGNADAWYHNGGLYYVNRLNQQIYGFVQNHPDVYLNDLNYEAAWYGLERWYDQSIWYLYKYAFAMEAIPMVCFNISNIIKSIFGKNKKALAIDLDNTLWGGVIGEEGKEKIKLGSETPDGMAFLDFQKYLKKLSELGITLNICSKNDQQLAKEGFSHPASILKEKDFTLLKINWKDKDSNLKEIYKELNLLPDSLVFLDDNPFERDYVREQLPNVKVPNFDYPENYVRILDQSGFFEITSVSEDDIKRNQYYQENRTRESFVSQFSVYSDYLKSLNMICIFVPIYKGNIERIVQLINKTNQFNLTSIRWTQQQIEQYLLEKKTISICASLTDRFGENGIVSCLIGQMENQCFSIDLWVMSCRVFKRELEKAIFDELVLCCKNKNIIKIYGIYNKTKKNGFVEELYPSLGFLEIERDEIHGVWEYDISKEYKNQNMVMEVQSSGEARDITGS